MTNREFFIQRWEAEFPVMRSVLQSLPPDKMDYRPHPKSRTAAQLVALLVYEEKTGIELCDTKEIRWQEPKPTLSVEEMIRQFDEYHRELAVRLRQLDDSAWDQTAKLLVADEVVLKERVGGLFWGILFDTVHHRGQLSVYIRPMGGKVPSIYGPSADDLGM